MIKLNISKILMNKDILLENINMDLENKVYMINGKNGVGKTTLLNIIYKLHNKYEGDLFIEDVNIENVSKEVLRSKYISYIFQSDKFFGNLSIKENIKVMNGSEYDIIMEEFSKFYDVDANTKVKKLSGGQRQFLNILIFLNKKAYCYLIDEPFNNLDQEKQGFVINKIKSLNKAVLLIDHKKLFKDNILEIKDGKCELHV